MKAWSKKIITGVLALVIMISVMPFFAVPAEAISNRTVKVGFFAYPGYHEYDGSVRSGYGYDFLIMLQRYTNLNFEFVGYENSWDDMQQMLLTGKIDFVTSARKTAERTELFDFSEPIGTNSAQINVRSDDERFTPGNFKALNGITIGEITGNSRNEDVSRYAAEKDFSFYVKEYDTAEALEEALENREVDAVATSSLRKAKNEKTIAEFAPQDFYVIVKKGNTELLEEINYGITQMDANEGNWRDDLHYANYRKANSTVLSFTKRERDYIRAVQSGFKPITVSAQPDRSPYSYVENGQLTGIIPDYFAYLMETAGLPYTTLVAKDSDEFQTWAAANHTDLIMDCTYGSSPSADFNFGLVTEPYMQMTVSRVTQKGFTGIVRTVATAGSPDRELIEKDAAGNAEYISVSSAEEAMQYVEDGKADACYVYTYAAEKFINSDPNSNLQLAALKSPVYNVYIYVSPDADHELCGILNKCIKADTSGKLDEYIRKYTTATYENLSLWQYLKLHPMLIVTAAAVLLALAILTVVLISRTKTQKLKNEQLVHEQEQRQKLQESLTFTNYFLSTYISAYYIDLNTKECQIYKRTAELQENYPDVSDYFESLTKYIFTDVHPDDRDAFVELIYPPKLKSLLAEQEEIFHIYRDISGGVEKTYRMQAIRGADENHAALGFIDITEDINRQREQGLMEDLANQQRHVKAFGDMVNAALWHMNINDSNEIVGVYWSDDLRRMLGYEENTEDLPNDLHVWMEIIHPDDRDRAMQHFRQAACSHDTDAFVYDVEYRLRRKSGEYCWYHVAGRMEYNDDGTRKIYGIIFDISADKQLQKALAAAETESKRNDLIYTIIGAEKWSYGIAADDEILSAQYADAIRSTVYSNPSDQNPMKWVDYLLPEEKDRVLNGFMAAIRDHSGNTQYDETFRLLGRDGILHWFRSSGRVLRQADGTGEFIGMTQDVTDQMEEQQKRLLGAIPLSPDVLTKANIGMWAFELDEGNPPRMYGDAAMLKLVGLDRQVAPEEMYHAWYDHIDEGSYGLVNDAVNKMISGEHAEVQYPWHYADGRTIIVRCGGVRNAEYTKGIRIEGTHQDVSQTLHFDEEERRRAKLLENELTKSKLRADALAYIEDNEPDLDKGIDFFGKRILELSGCDQIVYREIGGRRIVLNAPGIEEVPSEVCADCPFSHFESEIFGKEGVVLMNDVREGCRGAKVHPDCPVKSSLMQHIYSGGKLVGLFSAHYIRDYHTFSENGIDIMKTVAIYMGLLIGRIKEKQAEIARIEAESSNRAKTEFLFNMSHDIRTPMNAILGYTDIALHHVDEPERVGDSLKKIKTSGGHLLSLINDILEMSRIEAGRLEIVNIPLNAYEVTEGITNMSQALAATKEIAFRTVLGEIGNPYVYADELHTNQIIINLISNAIKYTEAGGTVEYCLEQISEPVNGIANYRITVRDNGIGMSEEFQKHLFESFSREQTATVSKQEGAGLGLAIVKRILDSIGGTITVQSEKNVGTTFTVELPLEVMDDEAIEKYKAEHQTDDDIQVDVSLEGRKVLLVEDNAMNREIATEILEETGLVIETAEDGAVAVRMVREKGASYYDFILMDIQMPVMNGYEATEEIRKLPDGNRIPIIALSANAFKEDVDKSLAAGMNAHVAKPIDVKKLLATMHSLAK